MNKKNAGLLFFVIFTVLFIGCNSLPKNVSRQEYNAVRDYVSIKVAGMTYLKLYENLKNQEPQYYYDSEGKMQHRETPLGSDYKKNNGDIMKIGYTMNQLTRGYKLTEQEEGFYSWSVRNYERYSFD